MTRILPPGEVNLAWASQRVAAANPFTMLMLYGPAVLMACAWWMGPEESMQLCISQAG
jgi:hypothetical protein